ncbi:MAG: flagellin [Lachnospira sp.]|nr:flagellin [Lachnospira sp.]
MNISSINSQNIYTNYQQLASGKRINSAADDAAGLAIAKKLETQGNGYDVGKDNAATAQDMINVADGALGSITDYLQRIRELSVQASNTAVYGNSEIGAIQAEIDQLKQGIKDVAGTTQFNTKNLLDGNTTGLNVASNPDGSGLQVSMPNSTLEKLGIADYDVTGNFDISTIDKALDMVSSARGNLGATSNRLDNIINFNSYASYNMRASQSRIEDTDFAKSITDLKKNSILEQYRLMMQKKHMQSSADGIVRLIRG